MIAHRHLGHTQSEPESRATTRIAGLQCCALHQRRNEKSEATLALLLLLLLLQQALGVPAGRPQSNRKLSPAVMVMVVARDRANKTTENQKNKTAPKENRDKKN